MLTVHVKTAFLVIGASGAALSAHALNSGVQPIALSEPAADPVAPAAVSGAATPQSANAAYDPLNTAIATWQRLQQSDRLPFGDYANFLLAHPGWPGETSRQSAAEAALDSGAAQPDLVVRFFNRFQPRTAAGHARFAEALAAKGQIDAARAQARAAWRKGSLRPQDEAKLIGGFGSALSPDDHDARMDMLLWQGSTSSAQRQIALVSPAKRQLFAARLAYRTNSPDASVLGGAISGAARQDPGFLADRATWLRDNSQSPAARASLAQPHQLSARPGSVVGWYKVLLTNARAAAADNQLSVAFDIARQVDDAYPPGTDMAIQSPGERDVYTDLVWLAGQTALKLNRARDAVGMFDRYSKPYPTPQTRSKGLYWAGRAAEAAGDRTTANQYYARAAGYRDSYYGQLGSERLGQALQRPPEFVATPVAGPTRTAFYNKETVRVAQLLGRLGRYEDQSKFVRQIAADATSGTDHLLATELSQSIGRQDLAVMVGRSALQNGLSDFTAAGYPSVAVPAAHQNYYTIIHAIARQESQFDRAAVSHAGARGMMQLMPGTAREQAGKLGLSYNAGSLTTDTNYNIQLGSSYFQRMLSYFDGSYPLAVAAYNAGPGNVNKWLRANGDPRSGGDMVQWVEAIPITETRNYVQRVLENAVVYDLLNPDKSRSRGPTNLSWYLGKSRPG
ncbi:lytic transglycosylase domain-containing protein [Sphingomonas japonica]|nr:lytic transglycosylase domain-containing protein [Sphingomonas japonica]